MHKHTLQVKQTNIFWTAIAEGWIYFQMLTLAVAMRVQFDPLVGQLNDANPV